MSVRIGTSEVGDGQPCLVVAEIGQNHNGSVETALEMVSAAKAAGADLVKFQKREVELSVPRNLWNQTRETPWGVMSYLDYRRRLELGRADFDEIDAYCRTLDIPWFASAWDPPSLSFLLSYDIPCLKIASASVTALDVVVGCAGSGRPTIMSTGMSTVEQIDRAQGLFGAGTLILLHCRSTYPCKPDDLNLSAISTLQRRYGRPTGFSDHCVGLWMSLCAVAMGACVIERHFTLNRSWFGTDQSASVEPQGLTKLVQQIRRFEQARGDGRLGPSPAEDAVRQRLRRIP